MWRQTNRVGITSQKCVNNNDAELLGGRSSCGCSIIDASVIDQLGIYLTLIDGARQKELNIAEYVGITQLQNGVVEIS
jgi:hypothetical protein